MPIALTGHGEAANWTATPGSTLASAAFAVNAGDTIVVVHNNLPPNSVFTDTAGNAYAPVNIGNIQFWIAINAKPNAANIVTGNWSSATFSYIAAQSFSGCDPKNPLDTSAMLPFGTAGATTNPFSPSIATRWPVEAVIGWLQSSSGTATTVGAGYTLISNPGTVTTLAQLVEYQLLSTVQPSIQATAVNGTAANWGMGIIALVGAGQRPASAGDLGPGYDFFYRM